MKIRRLELLSEEELSVILTRAGETLENVKTGVSEILSEIKKRGIVAVLEFTQKFDGVNLPSLEAPVEELEAVDESSVEFDFLRAAAQNIEKFHTNQFENVCAEKKIEIEKGVELWREWRSIESVGIYAPGGLATYPSSVLMQAIPARLAGCREIILATPPCKDGLIAKEVIAAAKIAGVTKIFKAGGAQAIGALAFVGKVQKITGPGNPWVTEAKAQISTEIPIDMPAGPSEILVLADISANARFVAADLLSQAEHASNSSAILVTTSAALAEEVQAEVYQQLASLSRQKIAEKSLSDYGQILIAANLSSAIKFTNAYAPEHLEICTENPDIILPKIMNAGSVFLGNFASESAGDFATGSNHVLPTAGFARNFSALSVESFGKKIQVQRISREGLQKIRGICEKFGEAEGLDAHTKSISIRFED